MAFAVFTVAEQETLANQILLSSETMQALAKWMHRSHTLYEMYELGKLQLL